MRLQTATDNFDLFCSSLQSTERKGQLPGTDGTEPSYDDQLVAVVVMFVAAV